MYNQKTMPSSIKYLIKDEIFQPKPYKPQRNKIN